jgi:O-antigen/teichoic acid export membrane protein
MLPKRIEGAVFVLIGQGVQSIASFATGLILARVSGQDELGFFALGFSFCFLIICLGDTLFSTPYTYFISQAREDNSDLFRAALSGTLLLSILVGLFVFLAIIFFVPGLGDALFSLPLAIIALALREFYRRHLYATGKMKIVLLGDVLAGFTQVSMMLFFSVYGVMSANSAFISMSVASLLSCLFFISRETIAFQLFNVRSVLIWLRRFFEYGRWLVLGTACHVASVQLYPWLALVGSGPSGSGMYAACIAVTNLLNPLLIGLTNYFRPKFMRAFREKSKGHFLRYVRRTSLLFLAPALLFLAAVLVGGEEVLFTLYGASFTEGADALSYMGFGIIAVALSGPLQLALLAVRAPVTNLIYHGFSLALLLFLSALFWPALTLSTLGLFYGGVNLASLAVLFFLFRKQLVSH